MTELTLRPFRPDDVLVDNRDGSYGLTEDLAREQMRGGPAFTILDGEMVLGSFGMLLPWPGVGLVWMRLSESVNGHRLWLARIIKTALEDASRAYQLRRIEAYALEESERNQHWLEALGFTREDGGRARGYLPDGRDVIRYERVKGAPDG